MPMTDPIQRATTFAPMPELGTMRECVFCHFMVELSRTPHGESYWTAPADPIDGRRHCLGGMTPGNAHNPTPRTLHLPVPKPDGGQWAYWYTIDGEARSA